MVLVGVSIEDSTVGGYDVYAIDLTGDTAGNDGNNVTIINNITPADPGGLADLEGLSTLNNIVYAISESSTVQNILVKNAQGKESTITLNGSRFGDDVGADFAPNGVHYIIQGEDTSPTVGSQLYKVDIGTGNITKIGKQSTEFLDGLAISKELYKGDFAIASDFDSAEATGTDGTELYKINLATGAQVKLDDVKFVDFNGKAITSFNGAVSDSGLDYDEATDKLYAIADLTNDLYFATKADVTNNLGGITFKQVNDDLPVSTSGEFEGLALANLNVSFASSSSSLFNTTAGQDVLTAAFATMTDSDAVASI
jgi:hypothetical protein